MFDPLPASFDFPEAERRVRAFWEAHDVFGRSLEQRVIVSSAFAEAAGNRRAGLVSLGRYALRGVARPQELFTIDRSAALA